MRGKTVTRGTVAALVSLAVAGTAGAWAGQAHDHVAGGGSNGNPAADNHFSISARSGAEGTDANGVFEFHDTESGPPTERFTADVRCLRVAGNRATVVGQVRQSRNSLGEGRYVRVRLEDNGPPRRGESVDEIRVQPFPPGAQQPACVAPADLGTRGLSNGNVVVDDAP